MDESAKTIKSDTEPGSEPESSNINITLKTEGCNALKIKSEPEWPCPTDSEHAAQIEPNFKIEKSEYEFQSSYLNWTENKADDTAEEDDDSDYDDEDDDFSLRVRAKNRNKAIRKKGRHFRKSSLKERYTNFQEKRKYLDSFMLRSCPYCSKEFDCFTSWNAHLDDVHNHNKREETHFTYTDDGKAKCTECKTTLFFKVDTLKSHILVHLPHRNVYKCKICSLTKFRQFAMLLHIESRHFDVVGEALSAMNGKESKNCAYCDKYVGNLQMIAMHIKREHAELYEQKLWYMCPFCNEQFSEEKCHKAHLMNRHQFDTYEGLSFEIIREQETNDGKQKYRCLKCNAQLSGRFFRVPLHALTHLPYKCYKCRFCDYTHDRKWKVIKHTCKDLLLDIKNNPLLTAKTKPSNSKRSKSSFDGFNKLFVCPRCGVTFEEQSLWEVHLIKVHNFDDLECLNFKTTSSEDGTSVVSCTICERKFIKCNSYNLKIHAFVHMPYKLYKCKLCETPLNSMFPCACQVQNNASFLYICPQCGKEYNSQRNWNRHIMKEHDLRQPSGLGFSKIALKENEASIYNCSDCGEIIKDSEPYYLDLMFEHASIKHMPFKCYKCERCGESSDSKDIMIEHTSNCKIVLKHIAAEDEAACSEIAKCQCHVCGYLGDTKEIIVTHLSEAHQLEIVENYIFTWFCTKCEFKYDSKEEIFVHVLSIHLKKRPLLSKSNYICFFCPVCNIKFQTKPKWKAHLIEQHALNKDKVRKIEDLGRDWKCLECNKVYKKAYCQKLSHCIKHLPYKSFKCIICGEAFNDQATARTHVSKCSSKPMESKKRKLSEDDANKIHVTARLKEKKKRTKPTNIQKIKKNVDDTLSDPLKIDKSNVQNFSPTSMAISTPKTPTWNKYCKYLTYACPECNMPFETSEAWHMHISTHHDFFAEDRLNITTIPESGKKPKRVCNECGISVHGSILHAQRHKLTHMPYQAFICKICKHRSKTNNVLMYHIERQHFTPGKFKCLICQEIFETCHDRFEHTNAKHSGAKWPDKACRICMKLFTYKYSLNEHMKKHEFNRETFECGFCKRKYYYIGERKKHWKQIHPVEFASMINEEQEKLVGKKPVRKTKNYKKKKIISKSDENFVSDSSSDSIVLSKIKQTKRNTAKNARMMVVKEEPQSEINNIETVLFKNETESSDEIALSRLIPNKNRITNKIRINKIKTKRKVKVKNEENLVVHERIFKNEPRSDAYDTEEEFMKI